MGSTSTNARSERSPINGFAGCRGDGERMWPERGVQGVYGTQRFVWFNGCWFCSGRSTEEAAVEHGELQHFVWLKPKWQSFLAFTWLFKRRDSLCNEMLHHNGKNSDCNGC